MERLLRDADLATRLREVTSDGDIIVEAEGDRFLIVRVPDEIELSDPIEIALALDAAREYDGPCYDAEQALAMLRREIAEERRRE